MSHSSYSQRRLRSRRSVLSSMARGALVLPLTPALLAADERASAEPGSTSWASFRNGPAQRGVATCEFSDKPKMKWEKKSVDGWVATCAIVGDHVYAPALEGYLYCLDRETGEEVWKYRTIESKDEKEFAPGLKAAPLVTATSVYVGDEDGILHAIDRTSGRLQWKYATDAEIAGGVALYRNQLLLASHDFCLYSLSHEGKENWKLETEDRINCSPAVVDDFTFVSGCDAHLRVIDLNSGKEVRDVPMESHLIASPAVVNETLYVGSHAGDFTAVNWKTGEITWRYRSDREMPYHASAAVNDELVVVGSHDKYLHAIDRSTGEGRWKFQTRARIECSPAIVDERVFFGSGDGNLYGVGLKDGKEVWKFNGGKAINAGIAIGEGCLVVGEDDQNGALRCFG